MGTVVGVGFGVCNLGYLEGLSFGIGCGVTERCTLGYADDLSVGVGEGARTGRVYSWNVEQ